MFSRAGETRNVMEIPVRGVLNIPGAPRGWEAHPSCSSHSLRLSTFPFNIKKGSNFHFIPLIHGSGFVFHVLEFASCPWSISGMRLCHILPGEFMDGMARQLLEFLPALQTRGFWRENGSGNFWGLWRGEGFQLHPPWKGSTSWMQGNKSSSSSWELQGWAVIIKSLG